MVTARRLTKGAKSRGPGAGYHLLLTSTFEEPKASKHFGIFVCVWVPPRSGIPPSIKPFFNAESSVFFSSGCVCWGAA